MIEQPIAKSLTTATTEIEQAIKSKTKKKPRASYAVSWYEYSHVNSSVSKLDSVGYGCSTT